MARRLKLLDEIRACTVCAEHLPLGPRPIVSFTRRSRVLVVGQAPGTAVHASGVPWDDPSGERLRDWLGVSRDEFYDADRFAIVPMGFCYPGRGKSGDNPPRPECATLWMDRVRASLSNVQLTLLIGAYAQKYFLQDRAQPTLTETVRAWADYRPDYFVTPHPSPRNNIWLKKNAWFVKRTLPALRDAVDLALER